MSVERLPRRRRPSPLPARSHEDIYTLVEEAVRKADAAAAEVSNLHLVNQRVEGKLDKVIKAIGSEEEDERGQKIGTGLTGRLMRVELNVNRRFRIYDRWIDRAVIFGTAIAIGAIAVWWLVSDKVGALFKPH